MGAIGSALDGPRWSISTGCVLYAIVALAKRALWPTLLPLVRYWHAVADYQHGFLIAGLLVLWLAALWHSLNRQAKRLRPPRHPDTTPLVAVDHLSLGMAARCPPGWSRWRRIVTIMRAMRPAG